MGSPSDAPGFRACFPVFSWLVFHPQITAVVAGSAALVLFISSPLFACGLLCIWTAFLSFFLERKVLDRLFFPPFTAVICWAALGTGVGIPLMYSSAYFREFYDVYQIADWRDPLLASQCAYLLAFPFAWLGYWAAGFRKVKSLRDESIADGPPIRNQQVLVWVGWILLLVAVFLIVGKGLTGFEDRGTGFGARESAGNLFMLNFLPKFSMMGFVVVPFLWQTSKLGGKVIVGALVLVYAGFALASGSRGLFLYMAVFLFAGTYLFRRKNSRLFELSLMMLVCAGALLTSLLLAYRTSPEFQTTTSRDMMARLRLLVDSESYRQSFALYPEGLYRFGYSLFGLDDHIVFAQTPGRLPFAGFSGVSAVIWTWIPTTLCPTKPPLLDAEMITGAYESPPVKKKIGTTISLGADAWRRFGWAGVPPLALLAYALYGFLSRWCLNVWMTGRTIGWCLLVFAMMYFWSRPFGTVLGTWWSFFYDTPKHIAALLAVCAVVSVLARLSKVAEKSDKLSV
jgi:hypothetical protein